MAKVKRITLSYRHEPVGGEIRDVPVVSDGAALASAQHLVLLIHGYNNDMEDAVKAYEGFHARQRNLDGDARYGIGRVFVDVYWPGDGAWGIFSFLFYMKSIKHAVTTAGRLAAYLAGRVAATIRVDIVAHSMGCRLAMELLRALSAQPSAPGVGRMVLMAGAIPTAMLGLKTPSRRLRPAYDAVLREGTHSLYSGSDMVLAYAFPAGQSLASGDEGFNPTALGHELWVEPSVPLNLGQIENNQADHGDYWGWNTKSKALQCANKAAMEVNSYLQFPSAGSRTISSRPLMERSAIDARERARAREISKREVVTWTDSD